MEANDCHEKTDVITMLEFSLMSMCVPEVVFIKDCDFKFIS